jgi:hypothetical protein
MACKVTNKGAKLKAGYEKDEGRCMQSLLLFGFKTFIITLVLFMAAMANV